ncbi:MAG: crossover junction endodeoxyribonuclease RuvC [Candidatus Magasanikbacteria bacterium]
MKVIGIDPGTTQIGYGIVEKGGNNYKHIESGLLEIKSKKVGERLLEIEKDLNSILKKTKPEKAGVEEIFFYKNKKTAIKVAQARGVIIKSIIEEDIPLFEISPSEAKASVTGNGKASKEAVSKMVSHFLDIETKNFQKDITDALAIAITAATKQNFTKK